MDAFVTASFTVCIGAMAIVGAIQDGISGDWSVLGAKAVLDLIIIMVMTCAMGKGCLFSAIPVGILQGSVTILARLVQPLLTDAALSNAWLMSLADSLSLSYEQFGMKLGMLIGMLFPLFAIIIYGSFLKSYRRKNHESEKIENN